MQKIRIVFYNYARTFVIFKANRYFPVSKYGDFLLSLIRHIVCLRRFPRSDSGLLNDYLFFHKLSKTLENPIFGYTSDKEYIKRYVDSVLGMGHTVPTIAIIKSPEQLRNYNIPAHCCIKSTHSSGRIILRNMGEEINLTEIASWLDEDYYLGSREKNYRGLEKKIIIEEIAFNDTNLVDYKLFCHNGKVKATLVYKNRGKSNFQQFFLDRNFRRTPHEIYDEHTLELPEKPRNFDEIVTAAELISKEFELVRVDFYTNGELFYVGEITHVHSAGLRNYGRKEADISSIIFG